MRGTKKEDYVEQEMGYETPCWMWRKSTNNGKPVLYSGKTDAGRSKKVPARKYYYEENMGEVPKGLILFAECESRLCVRPSHMTLCNESEAGRRRNESRQPKEDAHFDIVSFPKGTECTYIVEAIGVDRVKIGRTTDLRARLKALQYASPVELRLVATMPGLDYEVELHKRFFVNRLHGEWFESSPKLIETAKKIARSEGQNPDTKRPMLGGLARYRLAEEGVTEEVVEKVRELFPARPYSVTEIMGMFGLTQSQVLRCLGANKDRRPHLGASRDTLVPK